MSPVTQSVFPMPTVRVYLKDGPTLRIKEHYENINVLLSEGRPIEAVTINGERVIIPANQVVSVAGPNDLPAPDGWTMQGRHIEVVGASSLVSRALREIEVPRHISHRGRLGYALTNGVARAALDPDAAVVLDMVSHPDKDYDAIMEDLNRLVCVVAEDMASALVVVFDPTKPDDDLEWINPASDETSIDLTVQAAKMLIQAEILTQQANEPDDRPSKADVTAAFGAVERNERASERLDGTDIQGGSKAQSEGDAERNARAFFEAGKVREAINLLGAAQVARWLTTLAMPITVQFQDDASGTHEGEIAAGPDEEQANAQSQFQVEVPDVGATDVRIDAITAWRYDPQDQR